jgi:hypothetical protein
MLKTAAAVLLLAAPAAAAGPEPGVFIFGGARFTVVAPECVRIEYSTGGAFADEPSVFPPRRGARFLGYSVDLSTGRLVIDTGRLRLSYAPDGWPPSVASLKAEIRRGTETVVWTPEAEPEPFLEGGAGVLARSGWSLVDDSSGRGTDRYLFGYGLDYKAGLRALALLKGAPPLPSRAALDREWGPRLPRRLLRLLSPALLSAAWQAQEQGLPLRRPLYLERPRSEEAYRRPQQAFIGEHLLELPAGAAAWLPDGPWFDLSTGEELRGPDELAARREARVLAQGGVVLAVRRSAPGAGLALRAYPGPEGAAARGRFYEDGAVSAELSYLRQGDRTRIMAEPSGGKAAPRSYVVELGGSPAERAVLDGKDLPVKYSPKEKLSRVRVPAGSGGFTLYVWQP